jgi:hypothetical protein
LDLINTVHIELRLPQLGPNDTVKIIHKNKAFVFHFFFSVRSRNERIPATFSVRPSVKRKLGRDKEIYAKNVGQNRI